jgi:hypothetical protein
VALSFANDPRGYLGTDTGAKVATLRVMGERGHLDPDVGYWAARWDPTGRLHPLYQTAHLGGRWVSVTTLPALYLAEPLYRLGGYRAALLLPMLGAVATALAARALARRLGAGDGAGAFWLIGLASPVAVYALDFWEHAIGLALLAWAVVVLLDVLDGRRPPATALVAGLLIGLAATMRTEALVDGAVATAAVCLVVLVRRRPAVAIGTGLLVSLGLAACLLANAGLERATVGAQLRSSRAVGTAQAGGQAGSTRTSEAATTAVGLAPTLSAASAAAGAGLLVLLLVVGAAAAGRGRADQGPVLLAAAGVALIYAIRFASGPGFVPGLVPATPLAGLGLALAWRSPTARLCAVVAIAALPLVWAFQYQGGAPPQWAGRYILFSGLLLGVVGIAALPRLLPAARAVVVAAAIGVTGFGLAWLSVRSHDVARAGRAIAAHPEPLIFGEAHLARELGGFYSPGRRWLTVLSRHDLPLALSAVEGIGQTRLGVIQLEKREPVLPVPGWRAVAEEHVRLFSGTVLRVTEYQRR